MQKLILVNENDEPIGVAEKMEAHERGLLHRAFSIFVFNKDNKLLLQQRAITKYHSPGLWTNTCCSHPYQNENILEAAENRLLQEMGFTTKLQKAFEFTYKANFENGLIEHEYDHVFVGKYNGAVNINEEEAKDFLFLTLDEIKTHITSSPQKYTEWFKIALPLLDDFLIKSKYLEK